MRDRRTCWAKMCDFASEMVLAVAVVVFASAALYFVQLFIEFMKGRIE